MALVRPMNVVPMENGLFSDWTNYHKKWLHRNPMQLISQIQRKDLRHARILAVPDYRDWKMENGGVRVAQHSHISVRNIAARMAYLRNTVLDIVFKFLNLPSQGSSGAYLAPKTRRIATNRWRIADEFARIVQETRPLCVTDIYLII